VVKDDVKNNSSLKGKEKALQEALESIERRFGKGTILRLGTTRNNFDIDIIPSGSLTLDAALGIGGIPQGRIIEIFGPESSGKSTLAFHMVAQAQKAGGIALYIDVEHALDPIYLGACGVNMDDLLVSQPDSGEQALEIADSVVRSGAIAIVVVDSVAALVPKAEIDGEMGDSHVGLQARLMSQALRKMCGSISNTRTAVVFINQIREKIGISYGNPETTPGGRALKFYASVRIDLRVIDRLKKDNASIGNAVKAKVVKNKVAPPFRIAQFEILFGHGISREGEIIDLATELNIIKRSGNHYQWDNRELGLGREATRQYLQENPDIAQQIESLIRAQKLSSMASQEIPEESAELVDSAIS
jgi:recombination protein RecA